MRTKDEKQAERAQAKKDAVAYIREALDAGTLPAATVSAMIEGWVAMQTTKGLKALMNPEAAHT